MVLVSAVQQRESAIPVHISPFLGFPSFSVSTEHWVEFPELYHGFSLVIYFIHSISCVNMSIPISQFLASLSFPPWYPYVCSLRLCLYFYFANKIIYIIFNITVFIYLWSSLLSRLLSSCGGFSCCGAQALGHVGFSSCTSSRAPELSSCGTRAQLLHSVWDLPGPEIEPMSPALAGRFLTTEPPGKSLSIPFW